MSDDTNVYYYRDGLSPSQSLNPSQYITPNEYLTRLTIMQSFSTFIIFLASLIQAIAVGMSEWFVLNVNEFIPTSKGGLWEYCFISNVGVIGSFRCSRYEELPNFAVFVNRRLYDSRILLLCSTGFCFLILLIEVFGILCLTLAESRGDIIDTIVAQNSNLFRYKERPIISESPNMKIKSHQSSKILGNEDTNSARFTTSIVVNANLNQSGMYRTVKPTGYFAFLSIALVSLIGSIMEFVLKVSGFALFDAYINQLLSLNTVFISYRSFSYWMVIISMGLVVMFWLFKVVSTRYIISLTRNLIEPRPVIVPSIYNNSANMDTQYNQYLPNYTTVSRILSESENFENTGQNDYENYENFPAQSCYDNQTNVGQDYLSNGSYMSRQSNTNSNFYHEYLQMDGAKSEKNHCQSPSLNHDIKSITSVVRF
ncbi:hypothetical protein BpHYR1_039164 [Brachionus plicatilis]|uniref:Uncharacterized protein n=1 Tax=Brachionus plicatilis TaxID=10195 RepID=A0A3M7QZJ8_BRAPC|nr:hypothetical protein BpHYR1_039164 [Brachionus plicatilis]